MRDGWLTLLREVRIAVAEVLVQIELESLGELSAPFDRVPVVRKKLRALVRRSQEALPVASPLRLAAVERRAVLDGDERVLQRRPRTRMGMDVAGRNRFDPERLSQLAQRGVATSVASLERTLKLDKEAAAAEGSRQPCRGVRVLHGEPMPRAARQADEPFVQALQRRLLERRLEQFAFLPRDPCPRMGVGQQPAEVGVARGRLDEQRHVRPVGERYLGAGDRSDAECLRRLGELQRAIDAVVVGQRERAVAKLGGPNRELLGQRGAVEERIG